MTLRAAHKESGRRSEPGKPLGKPLAVLTEEWSNRPTLRADGTLFIGSEQVVSVWERPLQARLAAISMSRGRRVLEVGFGLGLAYERIQERAPGLHLVLEGHPTIAEQAAERIADSTSALVMRTYWQGFVHCLPARHFSGILFDPSPLEGGFDGSLDMTRKLITPFLQCARLLLTSNGVLAAIDFSSRLATDDEFLRRCAASGLSVSDEVVAVAPDGGPDFVSGGPVSIVSIERA